MGSGQFLHPVQELLLAKVFTSLPSPRRMALPAGLTLPLLAQDKRKAEMQIPFEAGSP